MLYYLLIAVSTVMFGSQFFFQKRYQQNEGTSLYKSVAFALGTSAAGAVIMLMISKGKIEFSWFSFVLAAVSAAVNILLCYCSAMVLSYSNLSLYSLFMMLGGMLLPFMLGIVCYQEGMTAKKAIAMLLLMAALVIGTELKAERGVIKYCMAVFLLNGLSGVVSKLHQSNAAERISESGFMLLKSVISVAACAVLLWVCLRRRKEKWAFPRAAVGYMSAYGSICGVANFLVLIALLHVKASVQYPMITGGTIAVASVLSLLSGERLSPKNCVSSVTALIATLLLV